MIAAIRGHAILVPIAELGPRRSATSEQTFAFHDTFHSQHVADGSMANFNTYEAESLAASSWTVETRYFCATIHFSDH